MGQMHCVKSVRYRCFSGLYFPAFGLNSPYSVRLRENTDQKNSKYGHFSCSDGSLWLLSSYHLNFRLSKIDSVSHFFFNLQEHAQTDSITEPNGEKEQAQEQSLEDLMNTLKKI